VGERKVAHPLCSIQKVICSHRQHSGRWPGDKTTKYANKVNRFHISQLHWLVVGKACKKRGGPKCTAT